jgi:hypothetical protein
MPDYLSLKAEALHLAHHTSEALEAIKEAEAMAKKPEERFWCAELHRLRGVFRTTLGVDETKIEASFGEAIKIEGAEVGFARKTRRSNLRSISPLKGERVRRTWIPATSLVTCLQRLAFRSWATA